MDDLTKEKSPTAMAAGGKRAFRLQDVQRIREVRISSELDFDEVNHLWQVDGHCWKFISRIKVESLLSWQRQSHYSS